MRQLIHALSHELIKCLLCIFVFINVAGTSVSIKLLLDMYLSNLSSLNS